MWVALQLFLFGASLSLVTNLGRLTLVFVWCFIVPCHKCGLPYNCFCLVLHCPLSQMWVALPLFLFGASLSLVTNLGRLTLVFVWCFIVPCHKFGSPYNCFCLVLHCPLSQMWVALQLFLFGASLSLVTNLGRLTLVFVWCFIVPCHKFGSPYPCFCLVLHCPLSQIWVALPLFLFGASLSLVTNLGRLTLVFVWYFIVPCHKFGSPYLVKVQQLKEQCTIPISVCRIFVYSNNGMAARFRILYVHTDVDACDCTEGLYEHCKTKRVCTESFIWKNKIPCQTRESNSHQYCTWPFGRCSANWAIPPH